MTSCTREIITVQVGHYSNFVGTHLLNLQVRFHIRYLSIFLAITKILLIKIALYQI